MRASGFAGLLASPQPALVPSGVQLLPTWVGGQRTNSGAAAIMLAAWWCARRIILLGYDCQHTGARRHWHADHPQGLGNADGVDLWPGQFRAVLPHLYGAHVVNASRATALTLFDRASLAAALAQD